MKLLLLSACLLLALATSSHATETESQALVRSGHIAWVAATCATYSELSEDHKNQERYFFIALREGRVFFEGLVSNKILPKDAAEKLPFIMYDSFSGPSVDFRLGSMYQIAQREAFNELRKKDKERERNYKSYYENRTYENSKNDKDKDLYELYRGLNCDTLN